jgi:DNA mismatch endonuclease (patch repair protein)
MRTGGLPKLLPRAKRRPLSRGEMMGRIRSTNTRPEMLARAAVHSSGRRFRIHVRTLPGKPDLSNRTRKWAIFVHGCFWHSHARCTLASKPRTNQSYWIPKLRSNKARDRAKMRALRAAGYRVLVLWECDVRQDSRLKAILSAFFARVDSR